MEIKSEYDKDGQHIQVWKLVGGDEFVSKSETPQIRQGNFGDEHYLETVSEGVDKYLRLTPLQYKMISKYGDDIKGKKFKVIAKEGKKYLTVLEVQEGA